MSAFIQLTRKGAPFIVNLDNMSALTPISDNRCEVIMGEHKFIVENSYEHVMQLFSAMNLEVWQYQMRQPTDTGAGTNAQTDMPTPGLQLTPVSETQQPQGEVQ